jgi:hypothetical protein
MRGGGQPPPFTFPNYDVTPDGQRFLMFKPNEQAQSAPTQINVVLNWFEELKQKFPQGSPQRGGYGPRRLEVAT